MEFKTLEDFDLKGKTVLLRADLNVPAEDGRVTDTTRIDRLKPTIEFLKERGAKTMIISHFGRPKGERKDEFSLSFLSPYLETQWGVNTKKQQKHEQKRDITPTNDEKIEKKCTT